MRILADDLRILSMPSRYVQGAGALSQLGKELTRIALHPLLIIDKFILLNYGDQIRDSLDKNCMQYTILSFEGLCTQRKAEEFAKISEEKGCDLVAGVGGGSAIDIAKAAAMYCSGKELTTATIPTVASNDAPTSRASVIYSDSGLLEKVEFLTSNPALVLVDTAVIAKAPVHFLISGIGDALTTRFEAEQCFQSCHRSRIGGRQTLIGMHICEQCYKTIRLYAKQALHAVETGVVTEPLEAVVEATILLSGAGFENGGLATAHALTRGLSKIDQLHGCLHGYEVAYGLLVQFILEGREDAFLDEMFDLYNTIGLPTSLQALGLETISDRDLDIIVEATCASSESHIYKMVRPVNEKRLKGAILFLEALDRSVVVMG